VAVGDIVSEKHEPDTELGEYMTQDLEQFTQFARANVKVKFNSLMGLLFRPEGLLDSFRRLSGKKAPGVDGMRKVDYVAGLEERIKDLSSRVRRMGYRPKPVRRVYIPKASGGRRPLGIPAFECRIVQDRLSRILQSIWEPEFLECSFGFRPGKSAHDSIRRMNQIIRQERTNYVVEADIKGFFTHVDHGWMVRFLEERISDRRFLRTIQRFLKAGVMEDGVVTASREGTPQGGLVSPVLSNIYLHYVLDLWFERRFAKSCRGKAFLVRYCDDFVALFERPEDAQAFLASLPERLEKFNLEVEPSKTRSVAFGLDRQSPKGHKRGTAPRTFDFLGFTHFVTRSRRGFPMVGRKTQRERMCRKLKEVKLKLKELRTRGTHAMVDFAIRHYRGHLQYYAISGNMRSVATYGWFLRRILFTWLNRRSQRRSYTWKKFMLFLKHKQFPRARITHRLYGSLVQQT